MGGSKARADKGNQTYSWYSLDIRRYQLTGKETGLLSPVSVTKA